MAKRMYSSMQMDNDPATLYYNCTIVNTASAEDPVSYPLVRFQENRTTPYISNVEDYEFSIVRFTMDGPGKLLPMFIPSVVIGQNDRDLTIYTIGIGFNKTLFTPNSPSTPVTFQGYCQLHVQFQSESQEWFAVHQGDLPAPPLQRQDISSDYYYLSTYDSWLNQVNKTLYQCQWGDLSGVSPAYVAAGSPPVSIADQFLTWWISQGGTAGTVPELVTQAPFIVYDTGTGRFKLWAPSYGYGGDDRTSKNSAADEECYVYADHNMYNLFHSFPADYIGDGSKVYRLRITARNSKFEQPQAITTEVNPTNVVQTLVSVPIVYYVCEQENTSTSTLWNPIENITFTSTLIPVIAEATGPTTDYGKSTQAVVSSSAVVPIVTDIAVPKSDAYSYNGFIAYVPSGEYRMTSLVGAGDLRQVDIQVFWKCRNNGALIPVAMPNGSSVSIKMMFRRKTSAL
jgi:hypothetical protein